MISNQLLILKVIGGVLNQRAIRCTYANEVGFKIDVGK